MNLVRSGKCLFNAGMTDVLKMRFATLPLMFSSSFLGFFFFAWRDHDGAAGKGGADRALPSSVQKAPGA